MSDQPVTPTPQPDNVVVAEHSESRKPKSRISNAALVLGIVAVVMAVIPPLCFIAGLPAIASIVVGIIALASKNPRRGKAVTGLVLGLVAIVLAVIVTVSFVSSLSDSDTDPSLPTNGTSSAPAEDEQALESTAPEASEPVAPAPAPEPAGPDLSTFTEIAERDLALMVKNPDASIGQNLIAYGNITQFDAATGRCGFLASISSGIKESSYEYEHNSIHSAEAPCAILDPIVEGDSVKLWLTSTGSYSYDTQIGGNTTVPSFEVLQVELLPATEY
jgi:hypothetical protein